jgi:hypothetical protein
LPHIAKKSGFSMSHPQRNCPDCETALQPIKLIDATSLGMGSDGIAHVEMSYATPEAEPSFFLGKIQRQGTVKGFICPTCGRILLYGVPG